MKLSATTCLFQKVLPKIPSTEFMSDTYATSREHPKEEKAKIFRASPQIKL